MMTRFPLKLIGSTLLALLSIPAATEVATGSPTEKSIMAPLAKHSLLLGASRAGHRLVLVGERGHVLLSDDHGQQWRQVESPTRATLTAVYFTTPDLGWAVGHDAVILHSSDGGEHWQLQYRDSDAQGPLLDLWFDQAGRGTAVGAYGQYLRSDDGGGHWRREALNPDDDFHLNAIAVNNRRQYLAAEAGMLYRRLDEHPWQPLPSPYEGSFFGILPLQADGLLAFGLRGHLFSSNDHGDHWTRLTLKTQATLTDGQQLNNGRIVLVGHEGIVLWSDDGGRHFEQMQLPGRAALSALVTTADGRLLAVGERGIHSITLPAKAPPITTAQ